jgi:hypothetical protein
VETRKERKEKLFIGAKLNDIYLHKPLNLTNPLVGCLESIGLIGYLE